MFVTVTTETDSGSLAVGRLLESPLEALRPQVLRIPFESPAQQFFRLASIAQFQVGSPEGGRKIRVFASQSPPSAIELTSAVPISPTHAQVSDRKVDKGIASAPSTQNFEQQIGRIGFAAELVESDQILVAGEEIGVEFYRASVRDLGLSQLSVASQRDSKIGPGIGQRRIDLGRGS